MASRVRYDNRELTATSLLLTPDPTYRHKRLLRLWGSLILLIAVAALGVRQFEDRIAPESYLSRMRQENGELRDALNKARFDLEVELATRGELERQVGGLNDELKQVREELAFLKSAGAPAPRR